MDNLKGILEVMTESIQKSKSEALGLIQDKNQKAEILKLFAEAEAAILDPSKIDLSKFGMELANKAKNILKTAIVVIMLTVSSLNAQDSTSNEVKQKPKTEQKDKLPAWMLITSGLCLAIATLGLVAVFSIKKI